MTGGFLFKTWLTSGILCPIIMVALFGLYPGYELFDMLGFICIIYVFPCTLLLSIINIIALALAKHALINYDIKVSYEKLLLIVAGITATILCMFTVSNISFYAGFNPAFKYMLGISYLVALATGIMLFGVKDEDQLITA